MSSSSSINFYGAHRIWPDKSNKSLTVLKNISNRVESFKEKPICPEFKSRLDGPSTVWKIFKRQKEALDFAKDYEDVGVFSFEIRIPGEKGKRMFQVTHVEHMWLVHRNRPLSERCTYEVIREGAPSKLYLDLEYNIPLNPDKDGNKMVIRFIQFLCLSLKETFDIDCNDSQVLWLDSSTSIKFSCHLIFQLSNCAFKDNGEVGKFVHFVCTRIKECINQAKNPTNSDYQTNLGELLIKDDKGNETLFCDLAVYSRNRNFRLFLSTKYGKNVPLVISSCNAYCPVNCQPHTPEWEKQIFLDSLITNVRQSKDLKLLTFEQSCGANSASIHQRSISRQTVTYGIMNNDDEFLQGFESSPYPEVDEFVANLVCGGHKEGYIRHWRYFKKTEVLQYSIGNFRFCKNIKRHHKSNNIMIIVKLKERIFYQKCFDPDCQGFISQAYTLPLHATPAYFFLEEVSFSDMSILDDVMINNKELWADEVWEDDNFVSKALQVLEEADQK